MNRLFLPVVPNVRDGAQNQKLRLTGDQRAFVNCDFRDFITLVVTALKQDDVWFNNTMLAFLQRCKYQLA
jgi:hypothetical protein